MSSELNKTNEDVGFLAANLRKLMGDLNIDAADLSKRTGIALTTINCLRRGAGNPTLSTLYQLADFFDVSIGQLTERKIAAGVNSSKVIYEVPLLTIDELTEFLNNQNKYKAVISTDLDMWKPNKYYSIKINNNAMSPLFEKGTIFVISREANVHDGDIVLVQFENHLPCFRKVFIEGKSYFFKPISEMIGSNIIKENNFTIHGLVIKAIQHFHD